ncbi:TPA: DUF3307 domain-containing protein [Streptococcus agalactiae]
MISDFLRDNPILTLLFCAHFLADFQWQSQSLADSKSHSWRGLWRHLLIVFLPLAALMILIPETTLLNLTIWGSHIVIDSIKKLSYPWVEEGHFQKAAFIIDQLAHYTCIIVFYHALPTYLPPNHWLLPIKHFIVIALVFIIITKPINIVFKIFFNKFQAKELSSLLTQEKTKIMKEKSEDHEETIEGAGAMIGNLERLIMAILLISGQYAAIGLVFTAKSIARYDKISKSQVFAEYYLIGSLFSIISVLITHWLLLV